MSWYIGKEKYLAAAPGNIVHIAAGLLTPQGQC